MVNKFTYKMRSGGKWDVGSGTRPMQKKNNNYSTYSVVIIIDPCATFRNFPGFLYTSELTSAAKAGYKNNLYWWDEPNEPTKEVPVSCVLLKPPFASVTTVSRGHPSLLPVIPGRLRKRDNLLTAEGGRGWAWSRIKSARQLDPL